MSPLRRSLLACLALASICGAAQAQVTQMSLTLFPDIAVWDDPIEARISGVGCGGEVTDVFVDFKPGFGWAIDIDFSVFSCQASERAPFSLVTTLGPLHPGSTPSSCRTPRGTSSAPRHRLSTPPAERAAARLALRGSAHLSHRCGAVPPRLSRPGPSACFTLEPPNIHDNVIEAYFSSDCPILPPGGPHVFAVDYTVGPLPAGEYDVRFFDNDTAPPQALHRQRLIVHDADGCVPSDTALCLQDGRFRVEVAWKDFAHRTGPGHAIPLAGRNDSGLVWFFSPGNVELTVKVLDGCSAFGGYHWWVFISSASTVEYTVTVTDTASGRVKTYSNPLGQASPLIADTSAFACVVTN